MCHSCGLSCSVNPKTGRRVGKGKSKKKHYLVFVQNQGWDKSKQVDTTNGYDSLVKKVSTGLVSILSD